MLSWIERSAPRQLAVTPDGRPLSPIHSGWREWGLP